MKGLIKEGDPGPNGFISLKARRFMDYFKPDKVCLERHADFDSLNEYEIGDIFASLGLFVFLKEKLSWYPNFVGQFSVNMQWSGRKFEIYCLIDGTKFVLNPSLVEKKISSSKLWDRIFW